MKENLVISSVELYKKLNEVHTLVHNSIVNLMKSKGVTEVNLMLDKEGRDFNDDDYDEDWAYDNRVWVDCYGKYSNEIGYLSEVKLGKNDTLLFTAEGENDTYDDDYVSLSTGKYIDVLEQLENRLK